MSSLLFNIFIPVILLNKAHLYLKGLVDQPSLWALIIALSFPLAYGGWDFFQNKKHNMISLLGVLNILFTGGLALFKANAIWFALKEAVFPLLIGFFVLATLFTSKSFFEHLLSKTHILDLDRIISRIKHFNRELEFQTLLKRCTIIFSSTFLLSAFMNFFLALYIFYEPLPNTQQVSPAAIEAADTVLNQKIAKMTWLGLLVIGLPLTILTAFIFWHFIKRLSKITGLAFDDILKHQQKPK